MICLEQLKNCKIKTKIEHGGIRNRYAKFEIVDVLSIKSNSYPHWEGGYVRSHYSGSNPTSKQEVHTIYTASIYMYITKFFALTLT